jgi:isocitrate dehydrogenase
MGKDGAEISHRDVVTLLDRLAGGNVDFIKTEHLYTFDGQPGYSLGQGQ